MLISVFRTTLLLGPGTCSYPLVADDSQRCVSILVSDADHAPDHGVTPSTASQSGLPMTLGLCGNGVVTAVMNEARHKRLRKPLQKEDGGGGSSHGHVADQQRASLLSRKSGKVHYYRTWHETSPTRLRNHANSSLSLTLTGHGASLLFDSNGAAKIWFPSVTQHRSLDVRRQTRTDGRSTPRWWVSTRAKQSDWRHTDTGTLA